jgi:multidrug efflux pump subunit AcrA (membrane-fusion protein)
MVSQPVERYVTDHADFTARVAAVDSLDVKAHVWGYPDKVNFKEGALVKKGDVLFELDPRPYEALLNQAKAKVAQEEAQYQYDEAEYRLEAVAAQPAVAEALGVESGSALFLIERTSYCAGPRPVDYEKLYYRGDMVRFVTRLARGGKEGK